MEMENQQVGTFYYHVLGIITPFVWWKNPSPDLSLVDSHYDTFLLNLDLTKCI